MMVFKENEVEISGLAIAIKKKIWRRLGFPWVQTYLNIQYLRPLTKEQLQLLLNRDTFTELSVIFTYAWFLKSFCQLRGYDSMCHKLTVRLV